MDDIRILINELEKFRDERNWSQFHNTKDLALAISIEAAELNELAAENVLSPTLPGRLMDTIIICMDLKREGTRNS